METHSASELLEMGLLEKKPIINTEVVFLRNLTRRANLFTTFGTDNAGDDDMAGVEWGREAVTNTNGIRCNANVILAIVGARIPLGATNCS